jgi:hypothetical protein
MFLRLYTEIECDDNVEILTPPRIPYSATVSIPPLLLRDILTTLEGTTCEIGITRDGILFSTDSGSLSILNAAESDDQFAFKVKKAAKLVFNLSRLQMFANKESIASSTVHLSLRPSLPIIMEFSTETSAVINTYLALHLVPCVDDKDCVPETSPQMTAKEELDLSRLIQSSKKAADVISKKRTSTKRAKPKRLGTPSIDKKRPRKKRAPSTKPKKCAHCLETKRSEEFFNAELRKTKFAKCVDCTLVSCKQEMQEKEMVQARRVRDENSNEENGYEERLEIQGLHSLGCERYECPIFFDNKNDNIDTSLQASFSPAFPDDVTTLFGSYDIVYAFSDCGSKNETSRYKQRTVHGLLNLTTSRPLASAGGSGLYGHVEMDSAIQNHMEPHGGSFSFAQMVADESSPSFELPVAIVDYPRGAGAVQRLGKSTGKISLLARRTATTWNPIENPDGIPCLSKRWEKRIVAFETVEDVEKLVERWKKSFLANSWLRNHLSLPPELALKIHEYVAFRPSPAFFFEKDDLWISMSWRRNEQPTIKTILVARRRKS